MIYTHVLNGGAVRSPLDALRASQPAANRWSMDSSTTTTIKYPHPIRHPHQVRMPTAGYRVVVAAIQAC